MTVRGIFFEKGEGVDSSEYSADGLSDRMKKDSQIYNKSGLPLHVSRLAFSRVSAFQRSFACVLSRVIPA